MTTTTSSRPLGVPLIDTNAHVYYLKGAPVSFTTLSNARTKMWGEYKKRKTEYIVQLSSQHSGEPYIKPMHVIVEFQCPIPSALGDDTYIPDHGEYDLSQPSLGLYIKFIEECLTQSIFDTEIVSMIGYKYYSTTPQTIITIHGLLPQGE